MSIQAVGWAIEVQTGSASRKVVLITLANYADPQGDCWPSQATLARDTELSDRTVRTAMKELEDLGLISRKKRFDKEGKQTTDMVTVHYQGRKYFPGGPETDDSLGRKQFPTNRHREPSVEDTSTNVDDAAPLPTPKDRYWNHGRAYLKGVGLSPSKAASMLGTWAKKTGNDYPLLIEALKATQEAEPGEPVPWMFGAIEVRLEAKTERLIKRNGRLKGLRPVHPRIPSIRRV